MNCQRVATHQETADRSAWTTRINPRSLFIRPARTPGPRRCRPIAGREYVLRRDWSIQWGASLKSSDQLERSTPSRPNLAEGSPNGLAITPACRNTVGGRLPDVRFRRTPSCISGSVPGHSDHNPGDCLSDSTTQRCSIGNPPRVIPETDPNSGNGSQLNAHMSCGRWVRGTYCNFRPHIGAAAGSDWAHPVPGLIFLPVPHPQTP